MSDKREPTAVQLVAIIAEKTIDRLHVLRASGERIDFNNAARVLGEVINNEIDNGALITDEMCERLVGMPDELDETKGEQP